MTPTLKLKQGAPFGKTILKGNNMSSTGRNDRERNKDDHYITPRWAIREFMLAWDADTGIPSMLANNPAVRVLDPCAGGSPQDETIAWFEEEDRRRIEVKRENDLAARKTKKEDLPYTIGQWNAIRQRDWTLMPYEDVLRQRWDIRAVTMDIREEAPLVDIHGDYLNHKFLPSQKFDLITSNPPFSLIHPFIERSLDLLPDHGHLAFLLRLNYFGTQERSEWLKSLMPEYTYVHARRASFDPVTNRTDSIEYMHAVWRKGHYPKHTMLRIIPYGDDREF